MKIVMIVEPKGINTGIIFGAKLVVKKYLYIRYKEFENNYCEYVTPLEEKYEIICRRLKLKRIYL